ncbi:hypothetical protein [Mesorhizobium sp. M0578]|uniref:hypothetical protein n=1 Tax=unclassified Mesorhizobium TaxID=325217 RepID=UPI0033388F51
MPGQFRDYAFAAATAGRRTVNVKGATLSLEGVFNRMPYVMVRGYETRGAELAERFITKTDKVLEAGSSIGFMAITIIKNIGVSHYCMVDANPHLEKVVRENFRLSSVPSQYGRMSRLERQMVRSALGSARTLGHQARWPATTKWNVSLCRWYLSRLCYTICLSRPMC